MYQPYLRGKQFELIALKELSMPVLSKYQGKVSPIIEPVKDSSTFKSAITELVNRNNNFTVVINPQVGTFKVSDDILKVVESCVGLADNFQVGVIFHRDIKHNSILNVLKKYKHLLHGISIIHNTTFDDIEQIMALYSEFFTIKYNVINLSLTSRRYNRNFEEETLVEMDDYFKSQTKNADYLPLDETNFSEEHLYYKGEGFIGFSDYLSIGEEYSESGFLPRAIAIHISYSDDKGRIKIKHFVSDSNDDPSDIAGKFEEALTKLIKWCDATGYDSISIPIFRGYFESGHFPGLGTIKKLSIMNHIDVVLKLI